MKINQGIRKLQRFKNFDGPNPERGCESMTSLPHNHGIINISHFHAYLSMNVVEILFIHLIESY